MNENILINDLRTHFTQVPNALIEDKSISDRARFVFCYLASRPAEWRFYNKQLQGALGYSSDTVRKYLRELIDAGWLIRVRQERCSDGTLGGVIYQLLARKNANPSDETTDSEKHRLGKNHTHNNTVTYNNKEKSNKRARGHLSKEQILDQAARAGIDTSQLNQDALETFLQHRVEIKKPLTALAASRAVGELINHDHQTQKRLVDLSVDGRWVRLVPEALNRTQSAAAAAASPALGGARRVVRDDR